ncbi:MAG: FtsQ-type POTRA domain-containing protein [Acidobacteriota bacterium]|nr:FtsQ-type POTRA domain-containing protein [Acidobacteriota bacterium]
MKRGKTKTMGYLERQPSAILEGQRAAGKTKGRTVREVLRWSLKLSFGLLLASMLSFGLYWVRDRLYHSPRFDIAITEINGLQQISQNQVLLKISELAHPDRNLVRFDLDRLRRNLELIPWVKTVVVRRVLPDKLIVDIEERQPVAFARVGQETLLIDEEGTLLENNPEQLSQADFPVILGMESGFTPEILRRNRERIELYLQLIGALNRGGAGLSRDLSEVHLQDPGNVSVILDGDTVLVYLGRGGFQTKFRRYLAASRELKKKYRNLDSVDMRYRDQVVIRTLDPKLARGVSRKDSSDS